MGKKEKTKKKGKGAEKTAEKTEKKLKAKIKKVTGEVKFPEDMFSSLVASENVKCLFAIYFRMTLRRS